VGAGVNPFVDYETINREVQDLYMRKIETS
jgi:hypothetical protein